MAFERFTQTARSYAPKISIRSSGSFGFNQGAVRKYGLDKFPYVLLLFDKQKRMIGIKPVKTNTESGAIRFYHREKHSSIHCRKFFDYFEIPRAKFRIEPRWDDRESMLIFEIPERAIRAAEKLAS